MKKLILVLLVSAALLAGCAANKVSQDKYSGFLSDYSILKPVKGDSDRLGYLNTEADWQQYDSIMIDDVIIITPDGNQPHDAKLLVAIAEKYEEVLKQQLSKKFTVVNSAGSGVIRMQVAITSIFTSYDDLKGYQYIPVAAVFTGAKRATGSEQQRIRVMTEIRLLDSTDGQLLGQSVDLKSGENKIDKDSGILLVDIEPILKQWAQTATEVLSAVKEHVQ